MATNPNTKIINESNCAQIFKSYSEHLDKNKIEDTLGAFHSFLMDNNHIIDYKDISKINDWYNKYLSSKNIVASPNTKLINESNYKEIFKYYLEHLDKDKVQDNLATFQRFLVLNNYADLDKTDAIYWYDKYLTEVKSANSESINETNCYEIFNGYTKHLTKYAIEDNLTTFTKFIIVNNYADTSTDISKWYEVYKTYNNAVKIMNSLKNNKGDYKIKKTHRKTLWLGKKGGAAGLWGFTTGTIVTNALAKANLTEGTSIFANGNVAVNNTILGAVSILGGVAGAFVFIGFKNLLTKTYYKMKYVNPTTKDREDLEKNKISLKDFQVMKLLDTIKTADKKIIDTKKSVFIVDWFNLGVNYVRGKFNRNRLHTVVDTRNMLNEELTNIESNTMFTPEEKDIKTSIVNLAIREIDVSISRVLKQNLEHSYKKTISKNDKQQLVEYLDILAKIDLDKSRRKDKSRVQAQADVMVRNVLNGKTIFGDPMPDDESIEIKPIEQPKVEEIIPITPIEEPKEEKVVPVAPVVPFEKLVKEVPATEEKKKKLPFFFYDDSLVEDVFVNPKKETPVTEEKVVPVEEIIEKTVPVIPVEEVKVEEQVEETIPAEEVKEKPATVKVLPEMQSYEIENAVVTIHFDNGTKKSILPSKADSYIKNVTLENNGKTAIVTYIDDSTESTKVLSDKDIKKLNADIMVETAILNNIGEYETIMKEEKVASSALIRQFIKDLSYCQNQSPRKIFKDSELWKAHKISYKKLYDFINESNRQNEKSL